jgi:S-formylglutathione hydrolase
MRRRAYAGHILVDQGQADQFLAEQLHPEALEAAAKASGQALLLRRHDGYDHSYWFIQTFIADHLAHHAKSRL